MPNGETIMTLIPAYGRDYKNKAQVEADLLAGKDFVIADIFSGNDGRYCNLQDLRAAGDKSVNIRYSRLTKIAVFKL